MNLLYAILAGVLFGLGVYALLRRTLFRSLIGLLLIGHAVNLGIFVGGGLQRSRPPLESVTTRPTDPLPQALILTAIVIGFGFISFGVGLAAKVYETLGTDDTEGMTEDDPEQVKGDSPNRKTSGSGGTG